MSSSSSAPSSLATNATTSTSTPMSSSAPPVCSPAKKKVLNLPSGYHFLPTDAELVIHYLRPRLANANHRLPLPIFIHERILNYHPDILIDKYRSYGGDRWFFFTVRERKHVGGSRPNRTTPDNGHWNGTGSVRAIRSAGGVLVGCRRTLVFYEASRSRKKKNQAAAGLPPPMAEEAEEEDGGGQAAKAGKDDDGVKTDWTMYEYESLTSEAEFQALRSGNANKIDKLVLCTIQKKKHCHEGGGEGKKKKKSTKRKTKEELEDVPDGSTGSGGDVEQAGTTEVGQDEDQVQRALMEAEAAAAAAETQGEELIAYHPAPAAGVDNFNNVDPNQSMPYYYLANSLSPVPTLPQQETLMMAPASGDKNQIVMHQQSYYIINHSMDMKNSQSFLVQETPPQELLLPYLDTNKMAVPRGGGNTIDHLLQNRFVNMMPSQAPSFSMSGSGISTKSNVWEHSAELYGDHKPNRPLKPEDDNWWISHYQAKLQLPGREGEVDNPAYVTNSLSFVQAPHQQQTTVTALVAREDNHTAMHQRIYLNHSSYMWDSQFHVQGTTLPPQEEFLACSSTFMPAAAEAHTFSGFFPSLSTSSYGHLSTRIDHPGPSSAPFSSQQSNGAGSRIIGMQGPLLLNNQVNLNHQNSAAAASMAGYDQSNGVGLAPKIV